MDSARANTASNEGKQRSSAKSEPRRVVRSAAPVAIPAALRSAIPPGGNPLPPDIRAQMQARFGQDFGDVLVHSGPLATQLAERRDANAYAVGNHIVFGPHRYSPGTPEGRRLIAHELAHVVQQRRGGPPAAVGQASLESHADRAAAAAVPGTTSVPIGGSAGVGVMCDRSGRKKRRTWDDEEEYGEDNEEAQRRAAERSRTQERKQGRAVAGKSEPEVIAEQAERELRALEDSYDQPGAQSRSEKQKLRDLKRFQALLDELPADTPEQRLRNSQRQGAFDELQRTPSRTAGKPQDQYVAGGPRLPFMEMRPGVDHYAQPDYSIYRRKKDGSFERIHVNLKSDRLARMNRSQAVARARTYADQALRNSWHLAEGEGVYIRFAHTPPPDIQEAMLAELFRVGSPIRAVSFGNTVYREEHYRGPRAAARLGAPTRKQLARERAAARRQAAKQKAAERKAAAKKKAAEKKAAAKERAKKRAAQKKARAKERAAKKVAERKAAAEKAAAKRLAAKKAREEKAAARKRAAEERAAARRKAADERAAARRKAAEEREAARQAKQKQTPASRRGSRKATAAAPATEVSSQTTRKARKPTTKKPQQRVRVAVDENAEPATKVRIGTRVRIATGDDEAERERQALAEVQAEEEATPPKKRLGVKSSPTARKSATDEARRETPEESSPAQRSSQRRRTPATNVKGAPTLQTRPRLADAERMPEPVRKAPPANKAPPKRAPPPKQPVAPVPQAAPQLTKPPAIAKPPALTKSPTVTKPPAPAPKTPPKPSTQGAKGQKRSPVPSGQRIGGSTLRNASTQSRSHFGDQVKITVEETTGDVDKPYRVTTRITVSTSGSFAAVSGQSTSGGVLGSASGSHSVAYSKWMSEAEKNEYLATVAEGRGGPHPEMQIIELIASGKLDEAAVMIDKARQAFASPDAFAQRAEGDTAEISSEGDVSVGASAAKSKGRASIGGQIEISSGQGIQRFSTVVGDKELVTVVLHDRSGRTLGVSGGYGVAGGGYTDRREEAQQRSVSFMLDPKAPDYAARRSEILAATTLDQLNALAARQPQLLHGRGQQQDKSQVGTIEATVLGFGIAMDQGGFYSEGVNEDAEGRLRTVSGGGTLGGGFVAGGQRIDPSSRTDSFTGWTRDDNTGEGVTQSEHRQVDYARSAERLISSAKANPVATAVGVVTGNKPVVQERVDTSGALLVDDSFARIAEVAKDKSAWDKAWDLRGVSRGAYQEWEATRQKVLAANGDRYKIQQALAEWQSGDSGRSGDVERLAGETGVAFEFPDELADQRPVYESLVVHNPLARPQQLLAEGQAARALTELQAIDTRLGRLLQAIQMHEQAIGNPSKFAEMQQRITSRRSQVREAIRKTKPSVREHGPQPGDPDFVGPVLPEQVAQAQADREKEQQAAERKQASDQIHDLVGVLLTNREKENRTFATIEDELDDFYVNLRFVFDQINSLKPMYETWDKQIAELKTLYPKIGDSPDRANQFTPNRDKWNALYKQSLK